MREKEDYRATLQSINEKFPNDTMLSLTQVKEATGLDPRAVKHSFEKHFKQIGRTKVINKFTLARLLS